MSHAGSFQKLQRLATVFPIGNKILKRGIFLRITYITVSLL